MEAGGQVSRSTEIPHHIDNEMLCSKLMKLCGETLKEVKCLTASVRDVVLQVFEEKSLENGRPTGECLKGMFDNYHDQVFKAIDEWV